VRKSDLERETLKRYRLRRNVKAKIAAKSRRKNKRKR
jgi:hypothetical protein